jgi:hypothetical protein
MEIGLSNEFFQINSPFYVLQLDGVPSDVSLHSLVQKVSSYYSVVGISRSADYKQKALGHTVFFLCVNAIDVTFLEKEYREYIPGHDRQCLVLVDLEVSCAKLPSTSTQSNYGKDPITVHVSGLPRIKHTSNATVTILHLLQHFNFAGTITSVRLTYDRRHKCTKTNAFVTYLDSSAAVQVASENSVMQHLLPSGRKVSTRFNYNVPILIPIERNHTLDGVNNQLSAKIEKINHLQVNLRPAPIRRRAVSVADRDPTVQVATNDAKQPARRVELLQDSTAIKQEVVRLPINLEAIGATKFKQPSTIIKGGESSKSTRPIAPEFVTPDDCVSLVSVKAVQNKKNATFKPKYGYVFDSKEDEEYYHETIRARYEQQEAPASDELVLHVDDEDWDTDETTDT